MADETPQDTTAPKIDMGEQLKAQIVLLGIQQVADNSRLAQNTLLAFQKDLFQGGQGELGSALAALRGAMTGISTNS